MIAGEVVVRTPGNFRHSKVVRQAWGGSQPQFPGCLGLDKPGAGHALHPTSPRPVLSKPLMVWTTSYSSGQPANTKLESSGCHTRSIVR